MIGKELFEVLVSTVALFGNYTYIVLDILVILGLAAVAQLITWTISKSIDKYYGVKF